MDIFYMMEKEANESILNINTTGRDDYDYDYNISITEYNYYELVPTAMVYGATLIAGLIGE